MQVPWTNLQNILVPPHRVPYEALDEEVKAFLTEEQYASMANTSTFELSREDGTNFWYYDMSSGDVVMILDGGQPQPEQELM